MKRIKNAYNRLQAKAWDDARFKILILGVASYIALC